MIKVIIIIGREKEKKKNYKKNIKMKEDLYRQVSVLPLFYKESTFTRGMIQDMSGWKSTSQSVIWMDTKNLNFSGPIWMDTKSCSFVGDYLD